jgi:hypothetical protein
MTFSTKWPLLLHAEGGQVEPVLQNQVSFAQFSSQPLTLRLIGSQHSALEML